MHPDAPLTDEDRRIEVLTKRYVDGEIDIDEYDRQVDAAVYGMPEFPPKRAVSYFAQAVSHPWPKATLDVAPAPPKPKLENPSREWQEVTRLFTEWEVLGDRAAYEHAMKLTHALHKEYNCGPLTVYLEYHVDHVSVEVCGNDFWSPKQSFADELKARGVYEATVTALVEFSEAMENLGWYGTPGEDC